MTEEPYRWLEAIANRREYIRDQLKDAAPVFAFSRPEGILLAGIGSGQSKVFEIYDRHALAAFGHPVDIEKIRQALIEAAHLEGFTRAPEDVTVRRLLNFSLGPALKQAFEKVFAAPLIVEGIFAELGSEPGGDVLARFGFDGAHRFASGGLAVAHPVPEREAEARAQLEPRLAAGATAEELISAVAALGPAEGEGRVLEAALLERSGPGRARYRQLRGGGHGR